MATKKNIKVRDLKPKKDAKGGGGSTASGVGASGVGASGVGASGVGASGVGLSGKGGYAAGTGPGKGI
jgi:hypothetical protein